VRSRYSHRRLTQLPVNARSDSHTAMRGAGRFVICALACACKTTHSSAFATHPEPSSAAPVSVLASRDPPGAEELGIVEAHGNRPEATLLEIVAALGARVASLGGDIARVDTFRTSYEMVSQHYTYDCGTTETRTESRSVTRTGSDGRLTVSTESVPVPHHVPKTCTGGREVEAAVLTLTGRAFRSAKRQP
jgi:hypothetical protein